MTDISVIGGWGPGVPGLLSTIPKVRMGATKEPQRVGR
jgi:hypothetical protein